MIKTFTLVYSFKTQDGGEALQSKRGEHKEQLEPLVCVFNHFNRTRGDPETPSWESIAELSPRLWIKYTNLSLLHQQRIS